MIKKLFFKKGRVVILSAFNPSTREAGPSGVPNSQGHPEKHCLKGKKRKE